MRISDWSSDVCSSDLLDRHSTIDRFHHVVDSKQCNRSCCHCFHFHARHMSGPCARIHEYGVLRHLQIDGDPGQGQRMAERDKIGRLLCRHDPRDPRSEEHTSELQSLMRISYAVFCLKKKIKKENTAE